MLCVHTCFEFNCIAIVLHKFLKMYLCRPRWTHFVDNHAARRLLSTQQFSGVVTCLLTFSQTNCLAVTGSNAFCYGFRHASVSSCQLHRPEPAPFRRQRARVLVSTLLCIQGHTWLSVVVNAARTVIKIDTTYTKKKKT
jgi:hypothetical protein